MSNDDQNNNDTQSFVSGMTFWIVAIILFIMSTVAIVLQFIIEGPAGDVGPSGSDGEGDPGDPGPPGPSGTMITSADVLYDGNHKDLTLRWFYSRSDDTINERKPKEWEKWNLKPGVITIWMNDSSNELKQDVWQVGDFFRPDRVERDKLLLWYEVYYQIRKVEEYDAVEGTNPKYTELTMVEEPRDFPLTLGYLNVDSTFSRLRFVGEEDTQS